MINAVRSMMRHPEPGGRASILHVTGTLRAPAHTMLLRRVEARLARGERRLVLDLGGLSEIDAAGLGELVRAFNRTTAAGGVLEITRPNRRVRALLDATCLSAVLTSAQPAHAA
jgi:anti-sigma B factor antagonist